MTLEKIETQPEQTTQYQDVVMMSATDSAGKTIQVVDTRRSITYTEAQITAIYDTAKTRYDAMVALRDAE